MTFAVTAKGFLKEKTIKFLEKGIEVDFIWTDKLREAQQFNSRNKAINFLKVNELEGFAFNPHEAEPIRDKYIVKQRTGFQYMDEKHLVNEWVIEKATMVSRSDAKFLNGEDDFSKFYDKEEAQAIAIERNQNMVIELVMKIEKSKISND